jgi:hypothetical protein
MTITRFANGINPFTGQIVAAPKPMSTRKTDRPNNGHVDLDALTICDDPMPEYRALPAGKYDALLSKLKPGQCIKCPTSDVNRLSNAIKKHVERKHPTCMVRSMQDYGDGMGRVWMLPRPEKLKPA